jgi:hypothetical protein
MNLVRSFAPEQVLAVPLCLEPPDDILELDRKFGERSGFRVQFAPVFGKSFSFRSWVLVDFDMYHCVFREHIRG